MNRRTISSTGIEVPLMGLGTAPLGRLYTDITDDQAVRTIHQALDLGVSFIDTAPLYGNGLGEKRVGMALAGVPRESIVLATKIGILRGGVTGGFEYDFSRAGVERSLAASMERLGVDRLDIVHIHEPVGYARQVIETVIPLLHDLRSQGILRAISAGVNRWELVTDFAEELDCVLLAGRHTLIEQDALSFLDRMQATQRGVLLGGVYNSGILATGAGPDARYDYVPAPASIQEKTRTIESICRRHSTTMGAAALQFSAAHPAATMIVVGAVSPEEARQNVERMNVPIPLELWADLRAHDVLAHEAPVPKS